MSKSVCFNQTYLVIAIVFIILILYLIISKSTEMMEHRIKTLEKYNNNPIQPQPSQTTSPQQQQQPVQTQVIQQQVPVSTGGISRSPREINSLDRIYNPLRYPYKSDYFYDQKWYPNLELPFQVIGCGARNQPCLGGTQVPIYNPPTPIDISDNNIAPVYVSTRGPLGMPQQVGILYKIYGDDNDVYPLYGRKKYPNDNVYEYYTLMGKFGVKVPVVTKNRKDELGTNDVVFVKGKNDPYRVTIYKSDYPSYIPYL
jgi:hypothetical protein